MKKFIGFALIMLLFGLTRPVCFAQEEKPIFTVVEKMPCYPGGDSARIKFLAENIVYPQAAKEKGIQGVVYISFVIDEKGQVEDVRVLRGIGGGCDEEAMRIVKLMPNWIPGKSDGKNVRVQFNMPIRFTLTSENKDSAK
ncbi:MAG TPA: energy transducer TonB [Bacteroidales bacterium]|nr:energy transducer TonB [Bacteroidales bacterium]